MKEYYRILDIPRNASMEEIRKAYQKKARKFHPDRNRGDGAEKAEENFKEAKEAYEVLYDAEKRKVYDASWSSSLLDNPIQTATEMWLAYIQRILQCK